MNADIIRSEEQIMDLREALVKEKDGLPDYNIFGESTRESKQELAEWIQELDYALKFNEPMGSTSEIDYWLTDSGSLLGHDYGIT